MWLIGLAGCGLQVVTIYIDDHKDTVLPGIPADIPEEIEGEMVDVPLDLDWELSLGEIIAEQDISEGDLSSAVLMQLEIEVLEPKEESLGFLRDLVLMVDADNRELKTVADLGFGDTDGQRSRVLDASRAELVDYLMSPGLVVLTEANGQVPEEDIVLRLSYVVEVGVTLQGVTSQL